MWLLLGCLTSPEEYQDLVLVAQDADRDGQGAESYGGEDCNDSDPSVYVGALDYCDGLDNDCDGLVDEGILASTWYPDADRDGFGIEAGAVESCLVLEDHVLELGDCDDTNDDVNPGMPEVCNDGLDNDCSGDAPECVFEGEVGSEEADALFQGETGLALGFGLVVLDDDGDGQMTLALGAPAAGTLETQPGAVFLFDLPTTGTVTVDAAKWSTEGTRVGQQLGGALLAHDLNTDGFDDLIMGTLEGSGVAIALGTDSGIQEVTWDIEDNDPQRDFGQSFAVLERDRTILAVGAPDDRIFLFDVQDIPDNSEGAQGRLIGDEIGNLSSLSGGDYDGDGLDELMLNDSDQERVYILRGTDGIGDREVRDLDLSFSSDDEKAIGYATEFWDANGDGYLDATVSELDTTSGTVHIFYGAATPESRSTQESDQKLQGGFGFGFTLQSTADQSALLVTVPNTEYGYWFGGSFQVFEASADGPAASSLSFSADTTWCGQSGAFEDVNGDGRADGILGCAGADTSGRVHLFYSPTP